MDDLETAVVKQVLKHNKSRNQLSNFTVLEVPSVYSYLATSIMRFAKYFKNKIYNKGDIKEKPVKINLYKN